MFKLTQDIILNSDNEIIIFRKLFDLIKMKIPNDKLMNIFS
jgi:hypothetical protein